MQNKERSALLRDSTEETGHFYANAIVGTNRMSNKDMRGLENVVHSVVFNFPYQNESNKSKISALSAKFELKMSLFGEYLLKLDSQNSMVF